MHYVGAVVRQRFSYIFSGERDDYEPRDLIRPRRWLLELWRNSRAVTRLLAHVYKYTSEENGGYEGAFNFFSPTFFYTFSRVYINREKNVN